jgi:hypothetical protein
MVMVDQRVLKVLEGSSNLLERLLVVRQLFDLVEIDPRC